VAATAAITQLEITMKKYCRICWNTRYWREPTGEAAIFETAKSYVHEKSFGHEEWLFNYFPGRSVKMGISAHVR
jgi:hypothetical protein